MSQQPPENSDDIATSLTLVETQVHDMMIAVNTDHTALSDLLDKLYADGADTDALNEIQDRANGLAKTASVLNAATLAALEAARVMREHTQLLQESMAAYQAAVRRSDFDLPEVKKIYDETYSEAEAIVNDAFWQGLNETVYMNTGLSMSQARSLVSLLIGDHVLEDGTYLWDDLADWIDRAESESEEM